MSATKITPNTLKQLRAKNHYAVSDVASLISVNVARVILWEDGLVIPSSHNLLKLCVLYRTIPEGIYPELYQRLTKNRQLKNNRRR